MKRIRSVHAVGRSKTVQVTTVMISCKREKGENRSERGQPEKKPVKGRNEKRFAIGFLDVNILRNDVHVANRWPQGRRTWNDAFVFLFLLADLRQQCFFRFKRKIIG